MLNSAPLLAPSHVSTGNNVAFFKPNTSSSCKPAYKLLGALLCLKDITTGDKKISAPTLPVD